MCRFMFGDYELTALEINIALLYNMVIPLSKINYNLAAKPPQANRVEKSDIKVKTVARIIN